MHRMKVQGCMDALKGTMMATHEKETIFEVEGKGHFLTSSENEVIGMERLLAQHHYDDGSINSIHGFDILDSNLTQEAKTRLEFIDGILQETDDRILHRASSFLSTCEDFLLDYDQFELSCLGSFDLRGCSLGISELSTAAIPLLDSTCIKNLPVLENITIREFHEAFGNSVGHETSVTDQQWKKYDISLCSRNLSEFDNGSTVLERCMIPKKIERETIVSYNEGPNSLSIMECCLVSDKIDQEKVMTCHIESPVRPPYLPTNVSCDKSLPREIQKMESGRLSCFDSSKNSSSNVTENVVFDSTENDSVVPHKRLRKPTRRYIEESMEQKSRHGKCVRFLKRSEKIEHVRFHKQRCQRSFMEAQKINREEGFAGACIRVPFGLPVEKELHPKKKTLLLDCELQTRKKYSYRHEISDMETESAASQDNISADVSSMGISSKKIRVRRNHHTMWTLSEVMKLIEGVSKCGVGRWSLIKRLLFSSSTHRTAVDLKDKWRNLLRMSCKFQSKKKGRNVPEAVAVRVRELAQLHPYPRDPKSA